MWNVEGVCYEVLNVNRNEVKNVEVVKEYDIGVVKKKEDLKCELCEKIVIKIRDIIVEKNKENEFEEVIKGMWKKNG